MNTEALDIEFDEVVKVNPVLSKFMRLQEIAALGQKYSALKISGVEDKAGYDLVHRARMDVRARRIEVEKVHKEGKAEALQHCRDWDSAKNTLLANLEPIESKLAGEEKRIDDEIQAEKDRKQQIINDRCTARQNAMLAVNAGGVIHALELPGMAEADFQAHLAVATAKFTEEKRNQDEQAAELARLQAEEVERKTKERLEAERVAKEQAQERERLEAIAKAQQAAQDKIDRERREFEEAKRHEAEAKTRAEEIEKAKALQAKETEARVLCEAQEAAAQKIRDDAAKVEREKQEAALRLEAASDKEKLADFLSKIRGITLPHVKSAKHQQILLAFTNSIVAFDKAILGK